MGDQGLQKALSAPWSYPFVRSCGAILSPRPHAVSADVSSGGQERARIARPRGLVLDGHEDGGTIAANGARGETMRDIDLFQLALGLVPPWMVVDAKFDVDKKRLDIEIDFKTGGRFSCPKCGKADCPVHDTVKKTWRHLNFFQHAAFLHARVARIDCSAWPSSRACRWPLPPALSASTTRVCGVSSNITSRLQWHAWTSLTCGASPSMRPRPSAVKTTSRYSSTWTPGRSCMSPKAMMRRLLLGSRITSTTTTVMPPASRTYAST